MKILVTGGTGNVGSELVPRLIDAGHDVRVLTRSPYKLKEMAGRVEIAQGSLIDEANLAPAMEDLDAVFLLTPLSQDETEQGLNGVAAAMAAGVRRIVYLTVHKVAEGRHIPHFGSKLPVREMIEASGMEFVFLEPSNFFQTDLWIEDPIRQFGVYPQPLGNIGVNRVDVRDIADAAVNAVSSGEHKGNRCPVVGPERLTGEDCAAVWSKYLGKEVQYVGDDLDNWEKQAELMMPPWMARDLRIMYEFFQKEGLLASDADVQASRKVVGHPPRSFEDFVAEVAEEWK